MNIKSKKILDELEQKDSIISFIFSNYSFRTNQLIAIFKKVFIQEGFKSLIQKHPEIASIAIQQDSWFVQGIKCELLEPSKSWKKGTVKIKVVLEFIPDEPDADELAKEVSKKELNSPLDDIRQSIHENNQLS